MPLIFVWSGHLFHVISWLCAPDCMVFLNFPWLGTRKQVWTVSSKLENDKWLHFEESPIGMEGADEINFVDILSDSIWEKYFLPFYFLFSSTKIWNDFTAFAFEKCCANENGLIIPGSAVNSDLSASTGVIKNKLKMHLLSQQKEGNPISWWTSKCLEH